LSAAAPASLIASELKIDNGTVVVVVRPTTTVAVVVGVSDKPLSVGIRSRR